jgi:serine/threonine protein kinase/Tfp pilus assembly protein PilF
LIGKTISHYRIVQELGHGGMGVVYKAEDTKLGRLVALKFLSEGLSKSSETIEMFEREARAASALNHPNICTVHDIDEHNGRQFIVMELLEGQTLKSRIAAGPLDAEFVTRIGVQIADALETSHSRSIVHRDVKPANIFILPRGQVKLLDFGIAKLVEPLSDSDKTASATAPHIGTVPYMAPEQLRREPSDHRVDIWALGIVLYEMTAGELPFRGGSSFITSSAILHDPPVPLPRSAPAGLRKVILRCLSKEPGGRYQRAGEVRAVLEALSPKSAAAPRPRTKALAKVQRARIRSLAVLPLENLSGNSEEEFFADGMTDALITTLAQIRSLRVISRTSVMRYKGARRALAEIGRELNVDALVEGTVLRSGDRVRISAQLIHASTDTMLWAKTYSGGLRDVLALQSEVAAAIAHEIEVELTPQEQARLTAPGVVDPEAYEAFLKGRYHWARRNPESLMKAQDYLRRAVSLDPANALFHAGLADAYRDLGWDLFAVLPPAEVYPKAKTSAKRALELDANCAEAHAALAWIATGYDWDWETAEKEFKRSIDIKPGYGFVHIWYSHFLKAMGRDQESFTESKRALECDPIGLVLMMHMGWYYCYTRQYDRAVEQLQKTLDLDSNFLAARMFLGETYEQLGMFDRAIDEFENAVVISGRRPLYLAGLGHAYAASGQPDKAVQIIQELQQASAIRYVPARVIAEIYIGLGDKDSAFEWLEKAYEQRNGWLVHINSNPRYDSLHSDARYEDLLRRMNLPQERKAGAAG